MRFVKKFFKCVFIIILLCAIAEAALRILNVQFQPVPVLAEKYFPKKSFRKIEYEFNQDLFEKDPRLLWRFRPGQSIGIKSVNQMNMLYDFEREPYKEAPMKILCLGDGCTAGIPNGYPDYLDVYLRQMGMDRDIAVYNAGVYGYSSYQSKKFLEQIMKELDPSIIITYFLWNDIRPSQGKSDQQLGGQNPIILKIYSLLSPTRVFQGCRKLLEDGKKQLGIFGGKNASVPQRVSVSEYNNNIETMQKTLESSGIPVIWIMPWHSINTDDTSLLDFEDLGTPANAVTQYDNYCKIYESMIAQNNVNEHVIRCDKIFTQFPRNVYFQEGGIFPSALAHNVIAEHLLSIFVDGGNIPGDLYKQWQKTRTYDSQHPHRLEAKIDVLPKVYVVSTAQPARLEVTYRNTGDTVWLDKSDFGYVELGCRLRDSKGNLLNDDYASFPIPRVFKPGDKNTMVVNISVPDTPGDYILEFDMKNVGICWFSDTGSPTVRVSLRVI
jgi:hypothetical protein